MCFALDKTNGNAGKWTASPFVRRQEPEVGNNVIEVALPKPQQRATENVRVSIITSLGQGCTTFRIKMRAIYTFYYDN
jgi:hypothetical protein